VNDHSKLPKMLTTRQVCEILNVTRQTLWKIRKRGHLKARRYGRTLRWPVAELELFLRRHMRPAS
jgi:excisionase family DNA binding protein